MDSPGIDARRTHQGEEVDSRRIARWAVVVAVALCAIVAAAWGIFRLAERDLPPPRTGFQQSAARPPASAGSLMAMRAAQQALLHSYGWVDRERGIVRIPVERAVELLLERDGQPQSSPTGASTVAPRARTRVIAPTGASTVAPRTGARVVAASIARRIGFNPRPGASLPLDAAFRDENGATVRLGRYFNGAPVIVVFTWFGCAALCPTLIGTLADLLARSGMDAGRDYRVVVVSIDPGDTPRLASVKRAAYEQGRAAGDALRGWYLLTGEPADIAEVTAAAGFRYDYDTATRQFAHPAGFLVATPDGRIAGDFAGFDFTPADLRDAVHDAAAERFASPIERALLSCFHFEPGGRYSATIVQTLRALIFAAVLGGLMVLGFHRIRSRVAAGRRRKAPPE